MEESISVIIPAYNCQNTIVECLNSVFAQTLQPVEVIVIDDGSTDETRERIEQFGDRVMLICQANQGASRSRNRGVATASGKWIAFLDSDDIWLPDKLTRQISSLQTRCWSHTNSLYIGFEQDGTTRRTDLSEQFGGHVLEQLLMDNFITTSTVLIRKDVFEAAAGFDSTMDPLEDWNLWLKLAKDYPIAYVEEPQAHYRIVIGSASRKARSVLPVHLKVIDTAIQSQYDTYSKSRLIRIRRRAESNSFSVCSYIAEQTGDNTFALRCSCQALVRQPFESLRWRRVARCVINLLSRHKKA